MANVDVLQSSYKTISKSLNNFDKKKATRDDLLLAYGSAIRQTPDHYQSTMDPSVKPTTIAGAARNLIHMINTKDQALLKSEPTDYMKALHEARKDGLWVLYDYKHSKPLDSSPTKVRQIAHDYQQGLSHEIQATRKHEAEQEFDGPDL